MSEQLVREEVISTLWTDRNKWAQVSRKSAGKIRFRRLIQLCLVILGSVLATASATGFPFENPPEGLSGENKWMALASTLALTFVALYEKFFLSKDFLERWPRSRAVSEAIKSEVFRFQAAAKPYDKTGSEDELKASLRLLADNVKTHSDIANDLLPFLKTVKKGRPAPGQLSHEDYIKLRLMEQADGYYLPTSQKQFKRLNIVRAIIIGLAIFSAVISALMSSGFIGGLGAWVAVLTTLSLAFATYASLQRYEFLATTYAKQGKRLKQLALGWKLDRWDNWSDFVNQCEATISAENKDWMAEMVREGETFDDLLSQIESKK